MFRCCICKDAMWYRGRERADLIGYTSKVVISDEEEMKKIQSEIQKVKKNGGNKWVTYAYPSDYNSKSIFHLDSLLVLKQRGKAVCQRLKRRKRNSLCKRPQDVGKQK